MPLYAYLCPKGHEFDRYLPLSEYDSPQTCECGLKARKVLGLNYIQASFEPYESPASGKIINGPKARREDLAQTNCRPWEGLDTEKAETEKRRRYADEKLEKSIQKSVEDQLRTV